MTVLVAGGDPELSVGVLFRHSFVQVTRYSGQVAVLAVRQRSASSARALACDVFDRANLDELLLAERPEVIVHQLSDLPTNIDVRSIDMQFAANDRLRAEGTRNLVDAARSAHVQRIIAQSYALAYAPRGGWIKNESDPLYLDAPQPWRRTMLAVKALETAVLETPSLEGCFAIAICMAAEPPTRRMGIRPSRTRRRVSDRNRSWNVLIRPCR